MRLLESEEVRLREENQTLRQEMARMDKMIYGTKPAAKKKTTKKGSKDVKDSGGPNTNPVPFHF